eukprot:CAMPEP_0113709072 /NCGR_PEP_ID=MMETSP0038_2-20120614/29350_1 /TAXON_ID=2898 /ORGANISM="Cryptomonas paramecium" /LENGTH=65 /DNA_ID=CAMNT_0000634881 /DNA_START=449 /DNA_END=643 /DNA_ORIENTATION=- /assembly_acc=CAM_ASM_000170
MKAGDGDEDDKMNVTDVNGEVDEKPSSDRGFRANGYTPQQYAHQQPKYPYIKIEDGEEGWGTPHA